MNAGRPDDELRPGSERLGCDVESWGLRLRYSVDGKRLGSFLSSRFQPSTLDTEGQAFLASSLSRAHRAWTLRAHQILTLFLSDFDVNALLGMYPVFLLSTPQALALLEAADPTREVGTGHLLDVGAGSGDVTSRLAPLVDRLRCAESSRLSCRVLRRRGFDAWRGAAGLGMAGDPLGSSEAYDVVALLNVLDRCSDPRALLRHAVEHLTPGGTLLVSVPLPLRPFHYSGSTTRTPEQPLDVPAEGFEEAARQLWQNEIEPLGLELGAITRMPYLSRGDAKHAAYVLDAVVLSLRRPASGE